jgi:AcrR family transcriptional regulator
VTTHTPRARLVRNSRVLRRADEIIDAAARVFAERGYHGTTTQAIADVLGMRQASLYYYFPSKEAALEEVCARGTDGFVEGAERVMQMEAPPLEKLKLLILSVVISSCMNELATPQSHSVTTTLRSTPLGRGGTGGNSPAAMRFVQSANVRAAASRPKALNTPAIEPPRTPSCVR